ncbi:MAG: Rhodanese domain protein [Candidatus Solibacter sp.]|jgi:rhodanese-related sulfurtransferase|nr:Rhodanese domain protein [Candidatus Solibacter sp.]
MPQVKSATPAEINARLTAGERLELIDVREPEELAIASIEGARPFPMSQAATWIDHLPGDVELVIICHHGMRSMQVAQALAHRGHQNITNLTGGIDLWTTQVDPTIPRY